jgi:putative membrane protein insertion efficiency factor
MKKVLIKIVQWYQAAISPLLGAQCLYTPTCSQYAVETLEEKPIWKALPKITARVLSCNPINGLIKNKRVDNA